MTWRLTSAAKGTGAQTAPVPFVRPGGEGCHPTSAQRELGSCVPTDGLATRRGAPTRRHRYDVGTSFTGRYRITRLVYHESFGDVWQAIAREKDIKRRSRSYRIRLIERHNLDWIDLAAFWYE